MFLIEHVRIYKDKNLEYFEVLAIGLGLKSLQIFPDMYFLKNL